MKPGIKTTEFWLTLVATALSFVVSQGIVTEDQVATVLGYAGIILAPLGYTLGRSAVKVKTNDS